MFNQKRISSLKHHNVINISANTNIPQYNQILSSEVLVKWLLLQLFLFIAELKFCFKYRYTSKDNNGYNEHKEQQKPTNLVKFYKNTFRTTFVQMWACWCAWVLVFFLMCFCYFCPTGSSNSQISAYYCMKVRSK